jgi:hypothetical protein
MAARMLRQAAQASRRREVQFIMAQADPAGLAEELLPVARDLVDQRQGFSRDVADLEARHGLGGQPGYRAIEDLVEEQLRATATVAFHLGLHYGLREGAATQEE